MSVQTKEKSPQMLAHLTASPAVLGGLVGTDYYSTENANCQDSVRELCSECIELDTKFAPKRFSALLLSASYGRLGESSKAQRVADCGTFLEFAHAIEADGVMSDKGKLHNANFCRDRLCPMCSWRRSYKIFAQVSQIMSLIGGKYKFIMLTLTVPNCAPDELSETVQRLFGAWGKLIRAKAYKKAVKGFFRALEVTRNKKNGTYHPHFHCILAVPLDYAESDLYIPRDEWLKMWRKCYQDESIISLDVRMAKGKNAETENCVEALSSAVAEIAKYAVKSSDYLIKDDEALTDDIVSRLGSALKNKRLATFDRNGAFHNAREELQLDDAEDGDLVHLTDKIDPSLAYMIVRYGWSAGAYKMLDTYIKQPESGVNE